MTTHRNVCPKASWLSGASRSCGPTLPTINTPKTVQITTPLTFFPARYNDLHFLKKRQKLGATKKGSSIMLRLLNKPHNRGAKDGKFEMSLVIP